MTRTPEQTAILLALLLKRAELKRARISLKTVRFLSRRTLLRSSFIERLSDCVDDVGWHLIELGRGGFGMIAISTLDGAKPILAKKYIHDELSRLRRKSKNEQEEIFAELRAEVEEAEDDLDSEE